ncbi:hypothetical protein RI129_001076 [Pyrocoelia pectoralis]|uniref:TRASH domain-containing protein n=1 Tax=Pyrocoelia pectoralis TaxID=417401 RepID=A0AAN7ZPF1_9COLE
MDVTELVTEAIMEDTSNCDNEEVCEDVQTHVNESEAEAGSDFIASLLEDSYNDEKDSIENNLLLGSSDEPMNRLELPNDEEDPKDADVLSEGSVDEQFDNENDASKEDKMEVDENVSKVGSPTENVIDEDTGKQQREIEVMANSNEEDENPVVQPPTEIMIIDDETETCELGKTSEEIPITVPDEEKPREKQRTPTPEPVVPTEENILIPELEAVVTEDKKEAEPVITCETDDAEKSECTISTVTEAAVEEHTNTSNANSVESDENSTLLDEPIRKGENEANTVDMEVQHTEEENHTPQTDTQQVPPESENTTSQLVPEEPLSSSENIQHSGDSLNNQSDNIMDEVISDLQQSNEVITESDTVAENTVTDVVEKTVIISDNVYGVNSEDADDSDPVFVHVNTESEKGNDDKNVTEKTSSGTQEEEENFQENQPQEDPIASDDFVALPLEDDTEPDPSNDEQVDEEQGASEAMCIIPDTERVISQAEKDAVASMVPLRDPTDSSLFSNEPSSDGASTDFATDKWKGSNPENYVVSRCIDENVNLCMQCCLPRKSKYSIMHQKTTTYICDDGCLSNFKRRHSDKIVMNNEGDLRVKKLTSGGNNDNMVAKVKFCRKCAECQKELALNEVHLSWQTMEFCKELCLSKYQKKVGSKCSNCDTIVRTNCLGKYCVRFGYNIRQFCSSVCLEEFKKGLKVCSYCQKDMSSGDKGQFKDFCTQTCMEKYDIMSNNHGKHLNKTGNLCSVCLKEKPITIEFEHESKMNFFCGEPCFVAFKFVNNITPGKCNMCKKYFDNKILEENSMFYDNALLSFCSKSCQNIYIIGHRKIVPCSWCKVKKYNFDMINRISASGASLLMCSLNCLNLYQVSVNAVQSKKKNCDHCQKTFQPLYHLTMSDASIRNFCSYACVMAFQNQFPKTPITLNEPEERTLPVPTSGPKKSKKFFKAKKKESVPAELPTIPTIPVISSVQSLATTNGPSSSPSASLRVKNNATTTQSTSPPITKTKILRQFIIKPNPIPPHRNIGTLCKINTKSQEVSVKPTTSDAEVQTDEIKEKTAIIPIPVPIYVPAPMWMYSMPLPVPFPFPLPVPVPIFIPTTRNSATGIMKEIKKIQVKIPTDPFEAELLMMAEMVAGDKKEEHTDSESEEEDAAPPPEETTTFSPEPVDPSNTFGDDMLQMALKMATELDEPAVDLEGALTVNTITASQGTEAAPTEETPEQSPPIQMMERQSNRGRKRLGRPPKAAAIISKRGRRTSMQVDIPTITPPPPAPPQEPVEKPDANMCLKYTFGVNAWKQWVTTKNAELEKSSRRVKLFKPEILQLTADELNYSLCLFVKEVRKPNGQEYAPDTIYYLCLGIQQYLFENARIDNIFCDSYYEKFTDCLDEVAKKFSVLYNDSHYIVTRVEEEHLWESKQLGAHSPHVLLSTLMFFNTKHFNLTTVDEHMQLSFSHIMKHWKRNPNQPGTAKAPGSRNVLLRFYPPQISNTEKVYEQQENEDNPLRCPVKLYEFYLSKCPESVKTRNDVFYLLPERSCVPDSPVWYSTMPLPRAALEKMLHRIKMVKEINVALLTS